MTSTSISSRRLLSTLAGSRIPLTESTGKDAIRIKNLPRSTTRDDLLRMLAAAQAQHIIEAQINYEQFMQSGTAILTLSHPRHTYEVLNVLRKASISEYFLKFDAIYRNPSMQPRRIRNRGVKGREEAAMRQSLTGDGAGAGIPDRGRAVLLLGLPNSIQSFGVTRMLQTIDGLPPLASPVAMVPQKDKQRLALSSRALLRFKNTDDAHRLVRMVHRITISPGLGKKNFEIRAKVVY